MTRDQVMNNYIDFLLSSLKKEYGISGHFTHYCWDNRIFWWHPTDRIEDRKITMDLVMEIYKAFRMDNEKKLLTLCMKRLELHVAKRLSL